MIYFKTYKNELINQAVAKRAEELGYKNDLHSTWYEKAEAVVLDERHQLISYSSRLGLYVETEVYEEGTLDDLFDTTKYKIRFPISVMGYDVIIYKDKVVIDNWITLTEEEVENLIREWKNR